MRIAFYGSSLLSAYWNGAATYYRGMLGELAKRGWEIVFFEPDAFERQQHRDIDPPDWAEVVVWNNDAAACAGVMKRAAEADVVVKASGVGVFDEDLLSVFDFARDDALKVYWDVDAPATLAEVNAAPDHPLRRRLPQLDMVLTYGGGPPVIEAYERAGARVVKALVPLSLFKDRNYALAAVAISTVGFAVSTFIIPWMIYVQQVRGFSPTHAALLVLPAGVMAGVLSPYIGKLTNTRSPKPIAMVSLRPAALRAAFSRSL